jgi:formate hydrogenlyase transcriptional activator
MPHAWEAISPDPVKDLPFSPRARDAFEEALIGSSAAFDSVIKQVEIVAPTAATVLIQGETGTGKELIARSIHRHSERRNGPFLAVNCASIPSALLESELFGHERGAFTGALSQQVGRFQLADRGTLFLDEIGELPPELQPKLLRVLETRALEPIGGTRTIHLDIRIIAATNRDLLEMVEMHSFRADLYYRLNVFPITLPPLRSRPDDIPGLVAYFVEKYSRQMNKRIEHIPPEAIDLLVHNQWPGNVRELENFIHRAVVMSPAPTLRVPFGDLRRLPKHSRSAATGTLAEVERDRILEVLLGTGWVLGGRDGAAAELGLARTTLIYRMQKLGIRRDPSFSRRKLTVLRNRQPDYRVFENRKNSA